MTRDQAIQFRAELRRQMNGVEAEIEANYQRFKQGDISAAQCEATDADLRQELHDLSADYEAVRPSTI